MDLLHNLPLYEWARALHLIFVIAWMAGLLMLPRFYAYQTGAIPGGELDQKMTDAAGKLRKIILTPSLIAVWALGLYMMTVRELWAAPWFHGKLLAVLAITGLHGWFVAQGRKLAKGERPRSEKFWRTMNEVPFVLAIVAVLLVVLEPMLG